jgi:carbonic anhydrase/acetyltransferase-like protein (isoleucine patch superfamily)
MSGPTILPWKGVMPRIAADAFIAPNAVIIGDVEIGPKASIWFNCVLRGDVNYIRIGARSNLQDGTIVHVNSGIGGGDGHPTIVGDDVLVGHMVMLHGTILEKGSFVGMSATLLDGVVVEGEAMVAAGALVSPGKRVPKGQLWAGRPAKYMRDLGQKDFDAMRWSVDNYVHHGEQYIEMLRAQP